MWRVRVFSRQSLVRAVTMSAAALFALASAIGDPQKPSPQLPEEDGAIMLALGEQQYKSGHPMDAIRTFRHFREFFADGPRDDYAVYMIGQASEKALEELGDVIDPSLCLRPRPKDYYFAELYRDYERFEPVAEWLERQYGFRAVEVPRPLSYGRDTCWCYDMRAYRYLLERHPGSEYADDAKFLLVMPDVYSECKPGRFTGGSYVVSGAWHEAAWEGEPYEPGPRLPAPPNVRGAKIALSYYRRILEEHPGTNRREEILPQIEQMRLYVMRAWGDGRWVSPETSAEERKLDEALKAGHESWRANPISVAQAEGAGRAIADDPRDRILLDDGKRIQVQLGSAKGKMVYLIRIASKRCLVTWTEGPVTGNIAFQREREIWVAKEDGSEQMRLTWEADLGHDLPAGQATWCAYPTWLPDRSGIGFVRAREFPEIESEVWGGPEIYSHIWVIGPRSRQAKPLVKVKTPSPANPYPNGELDDVGWFCVSPDGQWIAFEETPYEGGTSVYVAELDGTGLRQISPGVTPAWSPDGRFVALAHWPDFFQGTEGKPPRDPGIFLLDVASGMSTRLTDQFPDSNPAFAPDGGRVFFLRREEIWSIRVDGSNEQKVGTIPNMPDYFEEKTGDEEIGTSDLPPRMAWSPDRRAIIYEGPSGLWRFNLNDGSLSLLIAEEHATSPAWAPNPQGQTD